MTSVVTAASKSGTDTNQERAEIARGLVELAQWAVKQADKPLPPDVLASTALVFLDDIAAFCAAHRQPEIMALHSAAIATGASKDALLFAPGAPRVDRFSAAIANGTAGCWCELDEGFRGAACHAGLYVLPALLACAETQGLTVRQLLQRLAVGYEIAARVAETWTFPSMTMHPHAAYANYGAVAGAALAQNTSGDTLAAAMRLVGGLIPAGAYQAAVEGALVRNVWTGMAGDIGLRAVDWANAGLDGYIDGPHPAYAGLLGAATDPARLTTALGSRWAIQAGYHKLHGCCHSTHSAAEAALAMREQLDVTDSIDAIKKVELFTHRPTMSNVHPGNSLAARFSFEHVLSVALAKGNTGPSAFDRAAVGDPIVSRLRTLTKLSPYGDLPAWPQDRPARLEITLSDGRVLTTSCLSAPGGPDQPLSTDRLLQKVIDLTQGDYPCFAPIAAALVVLDEGTLASSWSDVASLMLAADRPSSK
jgi:2-methylcitrate dehydratase PrpD